jgi:hypothetical protein
MFRTDQVLVEILGGGGSAASHALLLHTIKSTSRFASRLTNGPNLPIDIETDLEADDERKL